MENKDWDKINEEKRLAILKGQTMNQSWNFVCSSHKEIISEALSVEEAGKRLIDIYKNLYRELLEVNKELLNSDEKTEK